MLQSDPPSWVLHRPKSLFQTLWDLLLAPVRMILLPDRACERLHLTSLRGERFAMVLPRIRGRLLDVGAGENDLVRLYRGRSGAEVPPEEGSPGSAQESVGIDVVDWGGGCVIVPDCKVLPFEDASFDTVTFVACLNHIPERRQALAEAFRVLRPGGRVVVTMIGPLIGTIGHGLWWYSEEKHRATDDQELPGMGSAQVVEHLTGAGFRLEGITRFTYWLNMLFVAVKPAAPTPS